MKLDRSRGDYFQTSYVRSYFANAAHLIEIDFTRTG